MVTASETRFAFGENWRRYLGVLSDDRIREAERSLADLLGPISGLRFLDVGCGSGLFSLAAIRLGATVYSFDLDPESVGFPGTSSALRAERALDNRTGERT